MYPVPQQFQTLGQELGSPNVALPYFPQPVVYDPELASQLRLVFETLEKSDNRLLRETLVYGTLIKLASKHSTHRAPLKESTRAQRQVQLVREFLEDFHPNGRLTRRTRETVWIKPFSSAERVSKAIWLSASCLSNSATFTYGEEATKNGTKNFRRGTRMRFP